MTSCRCWPASRSKAQSLGDDEICRFGMLMIFAGGETTEKTLATCFRNLVSHPEQLAALRADRGLRRAGDRRVDPVHGADAHGAATDQRGGRRSAAVRSRPSREVLCFLGSANCVTSAHYERPEVFDIHRKEVDPARAFTGAANHIAFGAGRRLLPSERRCREFEVETAIQQLLDAHARHPVRGWRRAATTSDSSCEARRRCTCDSTRRRELDRVENAPAHAQEHHASHRTSQCPWPRTWASIQWIKPSWKPGT